MSAVSAARLACTAERERESERERKKERERERKREREREPVRHHGRGAGADRECGGGDREFGSRDGGSTLSVFVQAERVSECRDCECPRHCVSTPRSRRSDVV
jgi:hypothetical protein